MNQPIVKSSPESTPESMGFRVDDLLSLPLYSASAIAADPVLIVAPHPDDETLGCGGAIALLRELDCTVHVLVISDGTLSHPNSRQYPAPALRTLRESETLSAMSLLGVGSGKVTFLRLPDGSVPMQDAPAANPAIARCQAYLKTVRPKTIFLPYRFDPHPDHRATWQLIYRALVYLPQFPRLIEYPIWDWDPEQQHDSCEPNQFTSWRLDIHNVVDRKEQAIATYRSQVSDLIDDDPDGFQLTAAMLANFVRPWEVYLEAAQ